MTVLLLFVGSTPTLYAQFNPTNPPEPEEKYYYNITVASNPANVANTSGAGKFLEGTQRTIRYSLRSNSPYTFLYWTLNGDSCTNKNEFTYTVTAGDAAFVAHFKYTPSSPQEPDIINKYKLFVESDNESACSFNIASGKLYEADSYVTLATYTNQGYEFLGWYENGTQISSNTTFNYHMPYKHVTLVAKFKYNPFNPEEPESDGTQEDIDVKPTGDLNGDGVVDVLDVVALVNYSLGKDGENRAKCDLNSDGVVDILDIVKIVNLSLE